MADIKFEFGEPYIENWEFEICVDRIDFHERKIDSKCIIMDKAFCLFELPKLGIRNTRRIVSEENREAKEWLKLYARKISNRYVSDWEQQPKELRLVFGDNFPFLKELRAIK